MMQKGIIAGLVVLSVVSGVHAQQVESTGRNSYFGFGYQTGSWDGDLEFFDDSQGGYFSFGTSLSSWLVIEAKVGATASSSPERNLNHSEIEEWWGFPLVSASGTEEITLYTINADLVLKPTYKIKQLSVYGIVGASFLFYAGVQDVSVLVSEDGVNFFEESETNSETDSEIGFVYGAGVAYDFGVVGINAEVSAYQYGDFDISPLFSIGGRLNF